MSKVTVIGLGAMGSRMAVNLLAGGHEVTVWNRTPANAARLAERGAKAVATAREAVSQAEFVISMLRDDDASRSIWLDGEAGILENFPKSAVAIESSTLTPGWTKELAKMADSAGISFLDACVSGSLPQVEARQLVYLVGGSAASVEIAKPILEAAGGAHVFHAGDAGAGSSVKLATNVLLGVQAAAMAEALFLLRRQGVDERRAIEIIGQTFVCSPFAKTAAMLMVNEDYAPRFPTELVEKDMRYALSAGEGERLPTISATREVFKSALDHGWANEHLSSIRKLFP